MNIYKSVLCVTACVAVVSLSACTPPAPSPTPPPSQHYDEWTYWSSGQVATNLTPLEPSLGLTNIEVPLKEFSDLGYIGVAKLESQCLVGIVQDKKDTADDTYSVVLFSRFNTGLTVTQKHLQPNGVKQLVQSYHERCSHDITAKAA